MPLLLTSPPCTPRAVWGRERGRSDLNRLRPRRDERQELTFGCPRGHFVFGEGGNRKRARSSASCACCGLSDFPPAAKSVMLFTWVLSSVIIRSRELSKPNFLSFGCHEVITKAGS